MLLQLIENKQTADFYNKCKQSVDFNIHQLNKVSSTMFQPKTSLNFLKLTINTDFYQICKHSADFNKSIKYVNKKMISKFISETKFYHEGNM